MDKSKFVIQIYGKIKKGPWINPKYFMCEKLSFLASMLMLDDLILYSTIALFFSFLGY
jgi:hypothetical protein